MIKVIKPSHPLHVEAIGDMYLHFFLQQCPCGGHYLLLSQLSIREDLGTIDASPPRKLKRGEHFFIDLFIGMCRKCKKRKEFYYSVIENNSQKLLKND